MNSSSFGKKFKFGVSSSAFQTEGIENVFGSGDSIWDQFILRKNKVKRNGNAAVGTDFYNRYEEDLQLIQKMNCKNFRFSIAWSRLLPEGVGKRNEKGIDFYDRLIDSCLHKGIDPWVTLYHWDLPLKLEEKGGWKNRDVLFWFEEYIQLCMEKYSDRVTNWIILNEPTAFTALGYYLGMHAPGKKGMTNFLPSMHHACMAQAMGGRMVKGFNSNLNVGTSYSMSYVKPNSRRKKDVTASKRVDAALNKLFLEPILGMGYPFEQLPALKKVEKYMKDGDEKKMSFDFDFIGIQNYSRDVVAHSFFTPVLRAKLVSAKQRNKKETAMGWEFYPKAIYQVLKQLKRYENLPPIVITESGVALNDKVNRKGRVIDNERIKFLKKNLKQVAKAKEFGVDVEGYFVWSVTDNFEWAEGQFPRFGLVYIDYDTQKRIAKKSAEWFGKFLKSDRIK